MMTCHKINNAIVCINDFVSLEPYGAKVWCDFHQYLGPTFYRSESAIKPIWKPSKKTYDAFAKWLADAEQKAVK